MNRWNYVLLFAFVFSLHAGAQRFRAGVIAGAVASDLDGADFKDHDDDFHKAGFTGGGFVNAKLSDKNSVQFEILCTQKGSYQPGDTIDPSYYLLKLDYIEVPVIYRHQLHIQVHSRSTDRFAFEFGPSFGALFHIHQEGLLMDSGGSYTSSYFDNSTFKRTELALNAGICFSITKNFLFDVRYQNSVIPVTKHALPFNTFFWKSFTKGDNMVFSFTLRYMFLNEKKSE
ncbi:MAG TPA: outer membrane beta-barrel protein [Bacteroidia bacterium]|jgi:hypothetical protein